MSSSPTPPPALEAVDRQFARFLERLSGGPNPLLALAGAALSRCRDDGHTCLELARLTQAGSVSELLGQNPVEPLPDARTWEKALRQSTVVGEPGQFRPLILDRKGRLYLHRYWAYETALARAILDRAQQPVEDLDEAKLREGLGRFFPGHPAVADRQANAAEVAVRRKLAVISGGPGTGKTRTVALLLALVLEQAGPKRCRIALSAPTGKAAARLQESIQRLEPDLPASAEVRARLPREAFTVHRLLGIHAETGRSWHHAGNPLPFEVVVVDEASMVDLALMTRLFAALPPQARLILLGDKDQLASVEPGAVLADLCHEGPPTRPLHDCIVRLEKNYRFGPNHGFLAFSQAVNAGDARQALSVLETAATQRLSPSGLPPAEHLKQALRPWVLRSFREAVTATEPLAALQALNRARILVALRQGPYGAQGINGLVEQILNEAGLIQPAEPWYSGRPILITRNDYQLGLFNGDVGLIRSDDGPPRAWFADGTGALRWFLPARLPAHETVFAMTVHKSQGSEFDHVLFVLPDQPSPVLTRELIYTGITRARESLDFWFSEPVLRTAITRRAERPSGLRDALWGELPPQTPFPKTVQLELGFGT